MSHFEAKMHQIRFRLGLCRRPGGELTALRRPPSWISSVLLLREERKGNKGKEVKVRERKGKRGERELQTISRPSFGFLKTCPVHLVCFFNCVKKGLIGSKILC